MTRLLCIVSREEPLLYGYLTTILAQQLAADGEVEVILDRRRGQHPYSEDPDEPPVERRGHPGIEQDIESRGFAVVSPRSGVAAPADPRGMQDAMTALARAAGHRGKVHHARKRRVGRLIGTVALVVFCLAGALVLALGLSGRLDTVATSVAVRARALLDQITRAVTGTQSRITVDSPTAPVPELPHVELVKRLESRLGTVYTLRVSDGTGRPLTGADVSIEGIARDGGRLHEPLRAAGRPGTYSGTFRAPASQPADLHARVVLGDMRFEVALP